MCITRNITCHVVLQVRPQMSEYSSKEISVEGALRGGTQFLYTFASGSFRCAGGVLLACGPLTGFAAMERKGCIES